MSTITYRQFTSAPARAASSAATDDVFITRPTGEGLVLTSAQRHADTKEMLAILAYTLKTIIDACTTAKDARHALAAALPWTANLSKPQLKAATKEIVAELLFAAESEEFAGLAKTIDAWRTAATAQGDAEFVAMVADER